MKDHVLFVFPHGTWYGDDQNLFSHQELIKSFYWQRPEIEEGFAAC